MKRLISILLACLMLLSLTACGRKEPEQTVEQKSSLAETKDALGYELLAYNTSGSTLQFESTAVIDGNVGQAVYQNGKSVVTLRMTLDKDKAEGLAGYKNAGTAGAIDAPTEMFSKMTIQVVDESTYFCEFSYTNCGCPCYLSLSETKTSLNLYSELLISYVNQLYNMEDIPSYVYAVDPSLAIDEQAPEQSDAEKSDTSATSSSQAETSSQEQQDEDTDKNDTEEKQDEETKPSEEEKEEAKKVEEEQKKKEEEARKAEEEKKKQEEEAKKAEEEKKKQEEAKKAEEEKKKEEEPKKSGTISLTYYDITLVHVGDAYTFEPKGGSGGYTWKSADSSIASVTKDGTVRAEGKGETTVTVTSKDGLSAEVIVRVPG